MAVKVNGTDEFRNIGYEIFIGLLSLLSILNLVLAYVFADDQNLQQVVVVMNSVFMPIFIVDFLYQLFTASSKPRYFFRKFGWADLLSSLPFSQAKILRVFRLRRIIEALRSYGFRSLTRDLVDTGAGNALLTVVFLVFSVLEFGSLAVLRAEHAAPNANITDASSALWWAYVTITTVGYGDRYPVTNAGRIVGIFVLTVGVGLFGTFSGFLADAFITRRKKQKGRAALAPSLSTPKARIAEIQRMLEVQEQTIAELKERLEEVSRLL